MSASPKIPAICSNATYYHKQGITGKNVTVAILDSGLAPHKEMESRRILAFHDFIYGKIHPYDDYSHGTNVTGIIGASSIGIAPEANIISLKVLDRHGNTSIETFIEGIKWLLIHQTQYNIRIANLSVGANPSTCPNQLTLLNLWVSRLWEAGIIVCCSAGNNGPAPNSVTAPGNCPDVITVGSCDGSHFSSTGSLAISHYSYPGNLHSVYSIPFMQNTYSKPELCAPGVHILCLKPDGGYHIKNGTSMSTPFVSGYCALLLQLHPSLTNCEVKQLLIDAAAPITTLPTHVQGAGNVRLDKLLTMTKTFNP